MEKTSRCPKKEELEQLLSTCYMEQIARKLGVTSNAIRKWIHKYGITIKAQKHKGFTRDANSIEKGRSALIKYYRSNKSHACKMIIQMSLDGKIENLYDSIRSVSNKGFNWRMVAKAVQGKLKTYKGFLWKECAIEDASRCLSHCHRGDGIIRVYKCKHCGEIFTSRKSIRLHNKKVHSSTHVRTVYKCARCGIEIKGKRNFRMHMKNHYSQEGYHCKFCGRIFSKSHQVAAHTARCKGNPNYEDTMRAQSFRMKNRFLNGMPQSTREKISSKMKAYFSSHPEVASYKYNHSSKGSWAEEYFDSLFKEENIKGYCRQYHIIRYKLDFAFIDDKVDFEVDGHQHRADQRIVKHDKERTENLKKLGWKTIRLDWGYYQSLSLEEKRKWLQNNLYPYISHSISVQ